MKVPKLAKKEKEMEKVYITHWHPHSLTPTPFYHIFLELAKMSYKLVYTNDQG